MNKTTRRTRRGEESLSLARIIEAAIALLDEGGDGALTFRALSARLATGAGAIYWHVANKEQLLEAACDAVVGAALAALPAATTPQARIRAIGAGMFDAIDAHPWVGAALARASWKLPMLRILEGLGREVGALGVPESAAWQATSALLNYILGVAGQNAANTRLARERQLVRDDFLRTVAGLWADLDARDFPFTRAIAAQLPGHDDRADFFAGLDFILAGIGARGA